MKVLFLDIDGVLNNFATIHKHMICEEKIDPKCVAQLNRIIEAVPDLKIVVSSSWRVFFSLDEITAALRAKGFVGSLLDRTKRLDVVGRGDEIKEWLNRHSDVKKFAILDDETFDMGEMLGFVVKTSMKTGLLAEHADELIGRLL